MAKLKKLSDLSSLNQLKIGGDGNLQVTDTPNQDKSKTVAPMSAIPNLGWLYFKNYFHGIDWKRRNEKEYTPFGKKNQELLGYAYQSHPYNLEKTIAPHRFTLKTTYPGLVCGTGVSHEVGIEGEFKLGFSFDHTTGLPVIPGSSVKGLLRSLFKNEEAHEFLQDLLLSIQPDSEADINLLEKEIFEGIKNGSPLSICKRDIFFDAVLVSLQQPIKILGDDYITPHINRKKPELSRFTNPVPIQLIKVLPNISFQFRFRLNESELISAENKLKLFQAILTTIGIGAKTNVGYGQFTETGK